MIRLRFLTTTTRASLGSAVAFLAMAVSFSGCSNLFGSEPEKNKPLVIQKESVACLKGAKADIQKFADDGTGDIGRTIDCTIKAIDDFTADTQGATNRSLYTRAELANFIEQYLTAADSRLAGDSPAYTEQGLNLKQLVMGGSSESISRAEIAKIKSLLLRARPILVELGPEIRVLLFKSKAANHAQVAKAKAALGKLVDLVAAEFDRASAGRPDWTVSDIVSALRRLDFKSESIEAWLPIGKVVKTMLLGGDEETIRPKEWSNMLRTVGRLFGLAVQVKYEIADNEAWLSSGLPATEGVVAETLNFVDQGIQANGGSIERKRIFKLIDLVLAKNAQDIAAGKGGLLPEDVQGLQATTAKNLLPLLLGKVLCGSYNEGCLKNRSTDLDSQHIGRLRVLAYDFFAGQKTINKAFSAGKDLPVQSVAKALSSTVITASQFKDPNQYKLSLRAQQQMIAFFEKGRPPVRDQHGRLIVVNKASLPAIKKSDAQFINALRVIVIAVLQGWTKNQNNAQSLAGLTEDETQTVYRDLTALGRDLNWMDTRNTQAGIRTFMETSIFMSSSNGDEFLNLQEAVEWFSFVSTGGMLADKIYEREFQTECGLPQNDVLGRKKVDAKCFRRRFLATWSNYLTNLPHLVSWVRADGSGERARTMLEALETAGRNKGLTDDPVDSSEFRSMIPIAQYLESVFARFDQNKNAILDHEEVWTVFPILRPFIKALGKGKADGEEIQRTVLSYILQYGECPEPTLIDSAWVAYWVVARRFQSDTADRIQVLKVIASFGIANRKERTRNIEAYYEENKNVLRKLLATGATTDTSAAAKLADLFQCQAPAVPTLADLLKRQRNLDVITPEAGPTKVGSFISRVKFLTENNETLQRYCLPF